MSRASAFGPDARVPAAPIESYHHTQFDPAELAAAKAGRTISVCLPAHNEAATVGEIVEVIRRDLVTGAGLVDEVLVVDDHSQDGTAAVARDAGARVVSAAEVLPDYGRGEGKGEVLWKSLHAAHGDLVVWCDADIREFTHRFVTGIVGPLLTQPRLKFVKGFYDRPVNGAMGGGRVTELVARPLLSLFLPELAQVRQPLSGEYGGWREVLEQVPFAQGYGVDVGLLIDIARRCGAGAIAQVDLDVRHHRNRPLEQLAPQALAVMQAILHRVDPALVGTVGTLVQPDLDAVTIDVTDRPAMVDIDGYVERTA